MERTGNNARRLIDMVKAQTGRDISPTMMSFILTGSRRCSVVNADALNRVTGVPYEALTEWPKVSRYAKLSGRRSRHVA